MWASHQASRHLELGSERWIPTMSHGLVLSWRLSKPYSPQRRCPLSAWLSWSEGPHGTETVFGRSLSPGNGANKRLKHTWSSCENSLLFVLQPQTEGQASHVHTSRGYGGAQRECRLRTLSLHSPLASKLTSISQKGVSTFLEGQFLQLPPMGHLQIHLEASRIYDCSHTALCIFAHFKRSCLRFWLSISLNISADWDSSFWNTDRSWHTLNNGELSMHRELRQWQKF